MKNSLTNCVLFFYFRRRFCFKESFGLLLEQKMFSLKTKKMGKEKKNPSENSFKIKNCSL